MQDLLQLVQAEIDALPYPEHPEQLYAPIRYFMGIGGKRMRPLLCLLACQAYGGSVKKALGPSLALELFHNFTLMHDDIMDQAPLRRGKTTIHEKWNTNVAILAGDVTLIRAYDMLKDLDNDIIIDVFNKFNETAIKVCEGQQFDMDFEKHDTVSVEAYIEMIALKTAVLLGLSMYMGARIGGASISEALKMYEVAKLMGVSFQIHDDYLDAFGDAGKVGKFTGGDIVSGKKTFLLIDALNSAQGSDKARLQQLLADTKMDKVTKVQEVLTLYRKLGVEERTRAASDQYYASALHTLQGTELPTVQKEQVQKYFEQIRNRDH